MKKRSIFICLVATACCFVFVAVAAGKQVNIKNADVAPDTSFLDFAFIAEGKYIVIATADSSWAAGLPYGGQQNNYPGWSAITNVNTDVLPLDYARLLHRKFILYNENGTAEVGKITSFKLLSEFIPHFGQVQRWNGVDQENEVKYTDEQIALDIRRSAPLILVAEFAFEKEQTNSDWIFAVAKGRTKPRPFPAIKDSAVEKKIVAAASKTATYKKVQAEYLKEHKIKNANWVTDKETNSDYYYFKTGNGMRYATLSHSAGNPCGDQFYAERFSIWQISKDATPVMIWMEETHNRAIMAVDIDNDNFPELFIESRVGSYILYKKIDGKWEPLYSWSIPDQDCPC